MYKHCKMGDVECLLPANEDRFYGIVEKIIAQNDVILKSMLVNPLVDHSVVSSSDSENNTATSEPNAAN